MESELRSFIAQVRRRWFRLIALRTVARVTCAASLPVAAAVPIDLAARPQGWPLIILAASACLVSIASAAIVLHRTQRRPDDRHVARYIEERVAVSGGGNLDDEIVSAVDVADGHVGPGAEVFKPLILADAARRLRAIDPAILVDVEQLRRARVEAAGGVCLLLVVLALGAPSLRRAAETAWLAAFPGAIQVDVRPGDTRVATGQPLQIRATIRGEPGVVTRLRPLLVVVAGTERRTVPMVPDGGGYRFDFESVDRSFRYHVSAGTAASTEYTVSALVPARVQRIDLRYQYPPFSGLAPRDEEDGGDIYAPAGTRVRLRVHTDKPVSAGELALGNAGRIALRATDAKVLEGDLTLTKDDSYRVSITDAEALKALSDTEYFIRLMDDRPPDVRILRPATDQQITPLEEVAIEARADDDYGISKFDLVYSVSGKPERVVAFSRVTGTAIQKTGAYVLPAEELGVQPGDVITYYARARDVGRGKQPTETKSDMFFLEVKPFGEEFVAAQSQGGGGGANAAQIEALIAAQKEIINATWNIERRSAGGRSEADIKALAQAQAELRARVEQMSRGSFRGRGELPMRIAPTPQPRLTPSPQASAQQRSADPIGAAVTAMARAHEQLEARRTGEAMPHEMAALNALLQAQAEVRRRQVAQQRAGSAGSGGSNRTGEDLSALFDKELQRQQRTNYETRSQVEERPERKESGDNSALDRIRDLARRQEELNRQQRDLANANLPPEELKRRLEKLTREQAELRQQAEELAKTQQGQGSSAMRDVAENMRNATSDLRRQDAQGAAQKGERAADQLRRIEQQGRGGSSGGQSVSQLQMEAQQIADAQRRIASEAERLDRDAGASGTDARRRLADEKDRLAGRVDDLQRAARQASQSSGRGTESNAAAEAARALERDQVGQRMRNAANQLRAGGKTAAGEQQIAKTLDQVVEKLGGDDADARRLAQELNQTREIRDRLNRLEQQIRDAEGRQRGGRGDQAQRGQPGRGRQGDGAGSGDAAADVQRLREQYRQELQRAREALARLNAQRGGGGATPEEHEYSRSAPGTEQFKQDRSGWESLRKDVDLALEKYEAAASDRLARKGADDRLSAGGSDRVPDKYRDPVAAYFQSLAKGKRK